MCPLELCVGLDQLEGLGFLFQDFINVSAGDYKDVEVLEALVSFFEVNICLDCQARGCSCAWGGRRDGAFKGFGL